MKASDISFLAFLLVLGVHIWLRDPSWQTRSQDTWPILAGIPLFIWFQRPWTFTEAKFDRVLSLRAMAWPAVIYLLGVLTNLTLILALAWTLLLRTWLITRAGIGQTISDTTKLLALPFLSFPWVATDLNSLGWAFRLSGAVAVEHLFSAFQFDVVRHGTFLWVQGKSMSVEAACSGLNGLQSMLIAGTTLAYLKLKKPLLFWANLIVLFGAAWLANTIRIVILALITVEGGFDAQNEFVHGLAGWGSLCLAFGLCWFIFSWQEAKRKTPLRDLTRQSTRWTRQPYFELTVLAYAIWQSGNLAVSWFYNPFDRWGWFAFVIWIAPFVAPKIKRPSAWFDGSKTSRCLLLLGSSLTFLGDVGSFNVSCNAGLALILFSLAPPAKRTLITAISAISWMPALGWFGSQLALDPTTLNALRLVLAAIGASCALKEVRPDHERVR